MHQPSRYLSHPSPSRHTSHCVAARNGRNNGRVSSFRGSTSSFASNSLTRMTPGALKLSSGGTSMYCVHPLLHSCAHNILGKYLAGRLIRMKNCRRKSGRHRDHPCALAWRTSDSRGSKQRVRLQCSKDVRFTPLARRRHPCSTTIVNLNKPHEILNVKIFFSCRLTQLWRGRRAAMSQQAADLNSSWCCLQISLCLVLRRLDPSKYLTGRHPPVTLRHTKKKHISWGEDGASGRIQLPGTLATHNVSSLPSPT
jgi:hypothetical protein